MHKQIYIILILSFLFSATILKAQNRKGGIYRNPIPNHSFQKTNAAGYAKAMKRGRRRGFGVGNPGQGITASYANKMLGKRGFGQGNYRTANSGRHISSLNRGHKFLGIFPSHRKFYRGHRSAIGLFKKK